MRLHRLAGLCTLATLALAGCSSSQSPPRSNAVARLPSTTATGGTAAPSGGAASAPTAGTAHHRARSKLFETEQEQQADLVPYANCMRAHHVPVTAWGRPMTLDGEASLKSYLAADRRCANTKPLPPLEQDASNPKALIFNRAVAACLRSHGVSPVTIETANGYVSIAFGDGAVTLGLKFIDSCQHQVAKRNH